jgi:hypothetical protein
MSKGFLIYDDAYQMLTHKCKGESKTGASLAC